MSRDPRKSVHYARMVDIIDYVVTNGPSTTQEICMGLGITQAQFRQTRYSLPGRVALDDFDAVMPRPICGEGYVHKLADDYRTGVVSEDAEPNIQTAISDTMTRLGTNWIVLEGVLDKVATDPVKRKAIRSLQRDLEGALDRGERVAVSMGAAISPVAQYVLDEL